MEALDHFHQHRIVVNAQPPILQNLHWRMAVANMPSQAGKRGRRFGPDVGHRLSGGVHRDHAAIIEQKPVAGTVSPRGNTRIIVVGDSIFLGNTLIESGGNRDFLTAAVNWLCDRPMLVAGIGPRPVTEFRLLISNQQQRQLNWLLLGALPGGVLIIGWFVWLVRRK